MVTLLVMSRVRDSVMVLSRHDSDGSKVMVLPGLALASVTAYSRSPPLSEPAPVSVQASTTMVLVCVTRLLDAVLEVNERSVALQSIVRLVSVPPSVGSPFEGVKS